MDAHTILRWHCRKMNGRTTWRTQDACGYHLCSRKCPISQERRIQNQKWSDRSGSGWGWGGYRCLHKHLCDCLTPETSWT